MGGFEMSGVQKGKDLHGQREFRGDYSDGLTPELEKKADTVGSEVLAYAAAQRTGERIEKLSSEEMQFLRIEIERLKGLLVTKEKELKTAEGSEEQMKIEKEIWIIEDGIKHAEKKIEGQQGSQGPSIYTKLDGNL